MFVHFGLYSTLGGEWKGKFVGSHEWIRHNARIPHEEYIPLADSFDPVALDVDGIVQLAKRAGPRRDLESRDARGADFTRYVAFLNAQLRELLTGYGRVDVLWFDGQWEPTWTHPIAADVVRRCRALQRAVIINNRVGPGAPAGSPGAAAIEPLGDFSTPELEVPAKGIPGEEWESCMTMNDNWGYAKDDDNWKSPARLVSLLVETASKGGNLLLNIGPMGDGRVPQPSVDALRAVGDWMRTNGEAIYATTASLVDTTACRTTTRGRAINCFMERWTPGALLLPGIAGTPTHARLLGDRTAPLPVRATTEGTVIELPERSPAQLCPVVQVEYDAPPRTRA